jgi:O-antigen/teichoic acid export membrane protein
LLAVFHLAVVFVLARVLGKSGLGTYYTLFALVNVFQYLFELGVNTLLTCRIAQRPERWRDSVAEAAGIFALIAGASVAAFAILGGLWSWHRSDPSVWMPTLAAGVACAAIHVQRYCAAVFRGFDRVGYENFSRALQGGAFLALVLALVATDQADVAGVLSAFAASHVITALFLVVILQRQLGYVGWRFRLGTIKEWLRESVPLGFGDVMRRLTWQLDTVLLGVMQPAAVVGIYSVAYRPLGPLNWLPQAVATAMFPSMARLAKGDRAGLERIFAHSIRLMWLTSLPVAVAICICAEPIISLLAGEDYLEAALPMRLLIWITIMSFLSLQFRFLFTAVARQRAYAWLVSLVFVLELVLEAALIPWLGYLGACTGSIVGELFFTVCGLALCRRLGLGDIDWTALAQATAAAVVMAALLWPFRAAAPGLLFAAVIASLALYVLLCIGLGALRWDEVQHLWSAVISLGRQSKQPEAKPFVRGKRSETAETLTARA